MECRDWSVSATTPIAPMPNAQLTQKAFATTSLSAEETAKPKDFM